MQKLLFFTGGNCRQSLSDFVQVKVQQCTEKNNCCKSTGSTWCPSVPQLSTPVEMPYEQLAQRKRACKLSGNWQCALCSNSKIVKSHVFKSEKYIKYELLNNDYWTKVFQIFVRRTRSSAKLTRASIFRSSNPSAHRMMVEYVSFRRFATKSVTIATSLERPRIGGRIDHAHLYMYISWKFGEDRSSTF